MVRSGGQTYTKTLTNIVYETRMRLFLNLAWIASCITYAFSQPFFTSFEPLPAPLIEWDQQNYTYYTGQTLQLNWTSQGFLSTDLARIQYVGAGGTRTLTTGSGFSIQTGTYSLRLSDSANGVATNVPLTIAHTTNTTNALQSTKRITVIQSKLMNIVPLDGNRTLGGGQNAVCDDRPLTVSWRGLGEAQFGVASITLRRQTGFTGTQTLASISNVAISGNTSVTLVCPRTATPSSSNVYAFELSIQEPGGSAYTGTSASFNVATAPTPTPSPTSSITPSRTPTPSPSPSKTPSPSPSQSNTPTPTETPTSSMTSSTTETARPSIDYAAIARTAAENVDTSTPAIAGALGGIGGVLVLLGAIKWFQNKRMTEKRMKKRAMTSKFVQDAHSLYGVTPSSGFREEDDAQAPSIVMYSVQGLPPRSSDARSLTSIKKGYAPKPTSK
jgi:hypothetical protein